MATPFTIFNNGVEKTLAAWGLDDLNFSDNDFAPSVVEFVAAGRAVDASDLFAYGSRVIIYRNRTGAGTSWTGGSCWFDGRVEPWERSGSPGSEDCIGRIVNAWLYFQRLQFKMDFWIKSGEDLVERSTNRVVLGIRIKSPVVGGVFWETLNTGQQIRDAVEYAATQGAPVAVGTTACWAKVLSEFQKCITVEQVIQRMWQIEPDFTCVWDYSTVGTNPAAPGNATLHFLKCQGNSLQTADYSGLTVPEIIAFFAANTNLDPATFDALLTPADIIAAITAQTLTPVSLDLDAGNFISRFRIKPRPDWIKSYVNIDYEQTNTVGTKTYLALGNDHYPDPLPTTTEAKFSGVDLYFDLAGSKVSVTTQSGQITSAAFDITSSTTWARWKPEINSPTVSSVVVLTASSTPAASTRYPAPTFAALEDEGAYNSANAYELLDGSYAEWMNDSTLMTPAGYPTITAQKCRATASLRIKYANGTTTYKQVTKEFTAISYNTEGDPKEFEVSSKKTDQYAEPQPVGLAALLYKSFRALACEGSFTVIEQEIGTTRTPITRANCLNFTGTALADVELHDISEETVSVNNWSNIQAPVRRVAGSALKGSYSVEFGAPLRLSANNLIDQIRAARVRTTSPNLAYLFGGLLSDSGGGKVQHPTKSSSHAAEHGAEFKNVSVVSQTANIPNSSSNLSITEDAEQGHVIILGEASVVLNVKKAAKLADGSGGASVTLPDGSEATIGGAIDSQGTKRRLEVYQLTTCEDNGTGDLHNYTRLFVCSDRFQLPGQT
jgi:hypothetical protein